MARVLLLNPNRWGRGITTIWIASHAAVLRARGHEVRLFDATFYRGWTQDEVGFNTQNAQYRPTDCDRLLRWHESDVYEDLQRVLGEFQPDVVFWSALSSHIHGEGEYVNIEHGHELMSRCSTRALRVAGGLQPTAAPTETMARFPGLDAVIPGESEFVLGDLVDAVAAGTGITGVAGIARRLPDGGVSEAARQELIRDLDRIGPYDYSLFDDQVFLRPYNGRVLRSADYELSRGCVFTCTYCVETVIQRYYGFTESNRRGALLGAKGYLRHKSAGRVWDEVAWLHRERGVTLLRCQDTNFLTIEPSVLTGLADLFEQDPIPVMLYVETRPEGISPRAVRLLERLRVDGVGMGIELSTQAFRENSLNRFADQDRIVEAFRLLRAAGIKRTAYNIIGLPGQDEASIIETIDFNRRLDPDNVTVAFYSPFIGTQQQQLSADGRQFGAYEYGVDAQLRTATGHSTVTRDLLNFYKANFVALVRSGLAGLEEIKRAFGCGPTS